MAAVVELHGVGLRYGQGPEILRGVNLALEQGDLRFLAGASGAGKSTLLRLLFLAVQPAAGRALLFGQDVTGLDARLRARMRRKIGIVFQDFRLLGHLPVFDNVALPLRAAGQPAQSYGGDVMDLLDWVGLKDKASALPDTLSGGEKQRVAIARAVVAKPDLILADEPTGNVDAAMAKRLMGLFRELNRQGATVVIATHDEQVMAGAAGRIIRLVDGTAQAA